MSKLGKQIINALRGFDVRKPVRMDIMRRMKVKGKTVYTRETLVAPIRARAK